jgi:putative spermidine/putrescine transport system permease protein
LFGSFPHCTAGQSIRSRGVNDVRNDYQPYSSLVRVLVVAMAVFLIAPVLFIVLYAFSKSSYFSLPLQGLTLKWFQNFFENGRFRQAIASSMGMAAIVTPLSLLIGIPTSYALVRGRFWGRDLLNLLVFSPLIIPGVVTGIAFLIFLSSIGTGPGFVGLVIAMSCFALPFAVRALVATLQGIDPEIEEAARNLGASEWNVFRFVVLPQLRPGMLAGGTFVFVEAIDNFSISAFLTGPRSTTLPVEAYGYIRDFDDPTVAAMAAVLICLSAALVFAVGRVIGLDRMFRFQ